MRDGSWPWLGRWLGARQVQLCVSEAAPSMATALCDETPEHLPFPCRFSGLPWMDMESRTTSKLPVTAPAKDLGESQQTGTVLPCASVPHACPEQPCLACCHQRAACGSLRGSAAATGPPCTPRLAVAQDWLSPAFLLALHATNQLRVPGGEGVSPPALLKSFSTKNSWLNKYISPRPCCQCFAELMGISVRRRKARG